MARGNDVAIEDEIARMRRSRYWEPPCQNRHTPIRYQQPADSIDFRGCPVSILVSPSLRLSQTLTFLLDFGRELRIRDGGTIECLPATHVLALPAGTDYNCGAETQ